jgi:hypothetical protein
VIKTAGPHATAHARLESPHVTMGILLTCQPEDWGSTRVFTLIARSDLTGDATRLERFVTAPDQVLEEDLATLERYTPAPLPLEGGAGARAPADRLSVAWRRVMARVLSALPGRRRPARPLVRGTRRARDRDVRRAPSSRRQDRHAGRATTRPPRRSRRRTSPDAGAWA